MTDTLVGVTAGDLTEMADRFNKVADGFADKAQRSRDRAGGDTPAAETADKIAADYKGLARHYREQAAADTPAVAAEAPEAPDAAELDDIAGPSDGRPA